ncbi:MAG: KH domain-containing protein [Selenomonas sp.]|nr:KH domain-containing protein [Selenomonas sp.]
MEKLVAVIAKSLVEHPDAVEVSSRQEDGQTVLSLHVAEDDMGKVIGRQGRIAKALRTVVKAAATRENTKVTVEII